MYAVCLCMLMPFKRVKSWIMFIINSVLAFIKCKINMHVFLWQLCRINTPRKDGGLGKLSYPLLSDLNHQIAKDYGVLLENEGHTLR